MWGKLWKVSCYDDILCVKNNRKTVRGEFKEDVRETVKSYKLWYHIMWEKQQKDDGKEVKEHVGETVRSCKLLWRIMCAKQHKDGDRGF